jgi:micrococcal nuclease
MVGNLGQRFGEVLVKALLLLLLATLALVAPTAAQSAVRLAEVTSPIAPGKRATVTVVVSPAARCQIAVLYKSGPSQARGLQAKSGARISWTWTVGTNTTKGRWPIVVNCGRSGTLRTAFVVR